MCLFVHNLIPSVLALKQTKNPAYVTHPLALRIYSLVLTYSYGERHLLMYVTWVTKGFPKAA